MSSLRRGHANLLCIVPILVYVLPKQALKTDSLPSKPPEKPKDENTEAQRGYYKMAKKRWALNPGSLTAESEQQNQCSIEEESFQALGECDICFWCPPWSPYWAVYPSLANSNISCYQLTAAPFREGLPLADRRLLGGLGGCSGGSWPSVAMQVCRRLLCHTCTFARVLYGGAGEAGARLLPELPVCLTSPVLSYYPHCFIVFQESIFSTNQLNESLSQALLLKTWLRH